MTPSGPPRDPGRARPPQQRPADRGRGVVARNGARQTPARRAVTRPNGPMRGPNGPTRRPLPAREPRRDPRVVVRRGRVARPHHRLVGALLVLLVAFGAIAVRLVQVQALGGDRYTEFGASQRFQDIVLPADRGSVFDRNGNDLAVSIPQRTVWADPALVVDPAATATQLASLLHLEPAATAKITNRLAGDSRFAYVDRRVSDDLADAVAAAKIPGVFLLEEPTRFAPSGDLARSVLGSVGDDNEGLSGLELQYDDVLTGEPGKQLIEKDPDGRTFPGGRKELEPAHRGDDLVLTIDRAMQYETERALAAQIEAKGAKGGTAIVSRPDTGEVLALANLRRDPDTGRVVASSSNTAAVASFEPGSVNKLITVAGALEEGVVSPSTQLVVPDRLQVGDHEFSDHDPHPTGAYTVTRILSESSNIGTIKIAQTAGQGPPRRVPAAIRLRPEDLARLPGGGGRHLAAAEPSTTARRSAPSPSGRASR